MRIASIALAVIALSACASQPPAIPGAPAFTGGGDNAVYVVGHGWHTGFVVPAARIRPLLHGVDAGLGDAAYLEFGWGDAGFYQAGRMDSGLGLRAVLAATDSVVYISPVSQAVSPGAIASAVARLCLSDSQLSSLNRFIAGSFRRDHSGRIIRAASGTAGRSRFYAGLGRYHLWNTCNTWTAKGLESAGMNISPAFKLTAGSVMDYLRGHGNVVVFDATVKGRRGQVSKSSASWMGPLEMWQCQTDPLSSARRSPKTSIRRMR